jgi:hypothetical protein
MSYLLLLFIAFVFLVFPHVNASNLLTKKNGRLLAYREKKFILMLDDNLYLPLSTELGRYLCLMVLSLAPEMSMVF